MIWMVGGRGGGGGSQQKFEEIDTKHSLLYKDWCAEREVSRERSRDYSVEQFENVSG